MTQLALAELLNYSDKAVSKWERGEAIPDVTVLKSIADHFGVSVDYLLTEEHTAEEKTTAAALRERRKSRLFTSIISVVLVWLLAIVAFSVMVAVRSCFAPWLVFIYALPVSFILVLVLNCVWGKRRLNYMIVTLIMWSVILSAYLTVLMTASLNFWLLFVIGAPIQVIFFFLPGIRILGSKKVKKTEVRK